MNAQQILIEAHRLLDKVVSDQSHSIISYNDTPGRTKQEVLAVFDKAIEVLAVFDRAIQQAKY
jgi:hypothetical protein